MIDGRGIDRRTEKRRTRGIEGQDIPLRGTAQRASKNGGIPQKKLFIDARLERKTAGDLLQPFVLLLPADAEGFGGIPKIRARL